MNMKFWEGITRRLLSVLLVLVLCIGMLLGTALAAGTDNVGPSSGTAVWPEEVVRDSSAIARPQGNKLVIGVPAADVASDSPYYSKLSNIESDTMHMLPATAFATDTQELESQESTTVTFTENNADVAGYTHTISGLEQTVTSETNTIEIVNTYMKKANYIITVDVVNGSSDVTSPVTAEEGDDQSILPSRLLRAMFWIP